MKKFKEWNDKIVVFGQSCAGKTTFSKRLENHSYVCFDELFQWHLIETLGLSIKCNLQYVKDFCDGLKKQKYILDGWHLSDKSGMYLPKDVAVYVVWASYEKIISQYRIPVVDIEEFRPMYRKWYCEVNYFDLPNVRYFENNGDFVEITEEQFHLLKT